ncbi:MAG: FAD-dependent oxidoreductase [bacterium]
MQSFDYTCSIPVTQNAEVIVIGGGPGGLGAAVMAARTGADVLLIERFGFLGGMAAAGEIHPFMGNHVDGEPLDKPVYTEWQDKMMSYRAEGSQHKMWVSKDLAMLAAEDLCLEAGVRLLYHHNLVDTIMDGDKITAVILHSKSGLTAATAKVFVDCTGDADLAARAGCSFEMGGPSGYCQPMTLCFKLTHVDPDRMPPHQEINRLYDEAKAEGIIDCPRENVLLFRWFDKDTIHFNTTRVIRHDGTSGESLSDAEIIARRQVREYLKFLRSRVAGFENAEIFSIAHHIGIRETRRIIGQAYITRDAFINREKFPDAIARVRYPIDIHNPDGKGTELVHMPENEWYEIPYGCIVAKDCSNLLVGGRPISGDHALHSSFRVMPPAVSIGQAAGIGAAMSVQENCQPSQLDGVKVREKLISYGARL